MGGEPELCETQKRIRELEIENVFLDKTAVLFVKDRASPRYRFVLEEKGEFPVKLTICVSGVSLTGFCSWFGNGYPQGAWTAGHDAAIRVQLESDRRFSSRFSVCAVAWVAISCDDRAPNAPAGCAAAKHAAIDSSIGYPVSVWSWNCSSSARSPSRRRCPLLRKLI